MIDPKLIEYAETGKQVEYIEAAIKHGSCRKAAASLGITHTVVSRAIRLIKDKAALAGYAPDHSLINGSPPGFALKKYANCFNRDGEQTVHWESFERNKEEQEKAFLNFVNELGESIKGKASPIKQSKPGDDILLSGYIIGDAHFGLYAWDEETGNNFDSDIAVDLTKNSIDYLVNAAPKSDKALLVNTGDFLHMDNPTNKTPQSGNILDVDTRFGRVLKIAAFSLRYCIEKLLKKHGHVEVINARGNHDPTAAIFLSTILKMYYEREPRVTIQDNNSAFNYFNFGINLIGVTHGDKTKMQNLPAIMADEVPELWGSTKNRMWWTGHIHHKQKIEFRGCDVESFNTLTAPDAWHAEHGYKAKRSMTMKVLHKERGTISESFYNVI